MVVDDLLVDDVCEVVVIDVVVDFLDDEEDEVGQLASHPLGQ